MGQKIQVNRVTNANVYANGKSFLGKAEEITLPDVKYKMSEHKAIGLYGAVEFPSGIEKLEAKIKWNSFYADVLKLVADPTNSIDLQVRANLETRESQGLTAEVPVVVFLRGTSKNFPLGTFKQHDNVESETQLSVTYFKMEINGEEIAEYDVLANVFKVNGEDKLAAYKSNLGI